MMITFPRLNRDRWKALVLVAALVTFVRIMLQPLIPETESVMEPSVIVEAGLIIPVFTVYAFFVYLFMSYSFVMLEARLPYSRMNKGLFFGAAIGAIWMAYLFEPVPLGEGLALADMLAYPLADGISVIVLGLLLGRYISSQGKEQERVQRSNYGIILLLPIILLAVRLFQYNVLGIYSSYDERTLDTILWVAANGLVIGLSYFFLRRGVPASEPSGRSLAFGLFFYGIPMLLVNYFVGIALKIDWADMTLRFALDIMAVILSVYLYERFLLNGGHDASEGKGALL